MRFFSHISSIFVKKRNRKQNGWMADSAMGEAMKNIGKGAGNTSSGKENTFRMAYPLHLKSSKKNMAKNSVQRAAELGKGLEQTSYKMWLRELRLLNLEKRRLSALSLPTTTGNVVAKCGSASSHR